MRRILPVLVPALAMVARADVVDRSLKIEFDELSAKAAAAVDTVNAMEQRAKDAGNSLTPDLLTLRALVRSAMDDAGKALRDGDANELRKCLDRARGLIDRLYKTL